MKTRDADILIIPGLGGSGPDHWQSRWESKLTSARRVDQADWSRPVKAAWVRRIMQAAAEADRPVVLVAHSLGAIAAAHALAEGLEAAGAFLVAPPSTASLAELPEVDPAFRPYPALPLKARSVIVGSSDDPYGSLQDTKALAADWGAALLDAGASGHINRESGHGPWPEGLMAFAGFLSKL